MYAYLSLSEGTPIGRIEGGKYNGKTIKVARSDTVNEPKEFKIIDDGKVKPLYNRPIADKSNRWNICGATLCGKSYFTGGLAKDYKKQNKKNKVVLFSSVESDPALDDIEGLYRIKCDRSIIDEPIELEELKDSLCIFDDINSFGDPDIIFELNALRDKLMKSGRHENIDVVSTNQILLDGKKTKDSLTNSFCVVLYPHSGGRYQMREYLKRYLGLDKDEIHKAINLPSRWVAIQNVAPNWILHEKGCYLL